MKTPEQIADEVLSVKEGCDLCLFGESARVFHFADGDYNDERVRQSDLYAHFRKSLVDLINTIRDQMVQHGLQDKPDLGEYALTNLRWVLSQWGDDRHGETLDKLIDWYEARIALMSHEAGLAELVQKAYDQGYQKGKEESNPLKKEGVSLLRGLFSILDNFKAIDDARR